MILSLKVSVHLIHIGVPCLLVLWCFQRATPLTVVACSPRPTGSFLRVCRLRRAVAWAPSRKLRWLCLELRGREKSGNSNAPELLCTTPSPCHAFHSSHKSVCFHYSYFMWYHGIKESYFLHGGGQVTTGFQVAWLKTSRGGGQLFWIQSIKTSCTNGKAKKKKKNLLSTTCSFT